MNTPTYAEPSYSDNAPKKRGCFGPWCLWASCGCLLLIVLGLGGMLVFGKNALEKAQRNAVPLTPVEIAKILPEGVPMYPGATVNAFLTRALNTSQGKNQFEGQFQTGDFKVSDGKWLIIQTDDSADTIADWYETKLKAKGWTRSQVNDIPDTFAFRKGKAGMAVSGAVRNKSIPLIGGNVWILSGTMTATGPSGVAR